VVTPPDSARLDGADNLVVQQLCTGRPVTHGQLPTDPAVQAVLVQALSGTELSVPAACPVGP
jgi:hypothetical protein